MGYPVGHFEIVGKQPQVLESFYENAFQWRMKSQMPGYSMAFPDAGTGINGGIGKAMDGGAGHLTFYVEVPDIAAMLDKIVGLGGKTVMPPMSIPGGPTIAMFTDPEGHLVGLVEAGTAGKGA